MEPVTKVTVLYPYELNVEFSDGVVGEVDLRDELHGEVFEPLKDPEVFSKACVDEELGTVLWPNGADFSPEFLYSKARNFASA